MNDVGEIGRGGAATAAGDGISYAPVPAWVDLAPYQTEPSPDQESCVANGIGRLLTDVQANLTGPIPCWSYRNAQRILTKEGAERASHIVIEFDPGYQRLEVHAVRILRGDQCIDHARPGCFQVFRRERDIERLMLNGRLSASFLVPDVRANDILEFSCTLHGDSPVLQGKYDSLVTLDGVHPSFDFRHRVLKPRARVIASREFNGPPSATISVTDEIEDLRRRLLGQTKRAPSAPLTPPWVIENPAFQLSEFAGWGDVAALMTAAYDSPELPPTLAEEVDRIGAAHPEPAQRAAEWLRFVQRELRYFLLALGEGGLVPRDLDAIWADRFGDCKDKARLYVAGARRLGLDACAALVSTTRGPMLDRLLPSPAMFDHCIVRVRIDGKSYWLDPTLPRQGGSLAAIELPHLGWALPLASDVAQLEKLPEQTVAHIAHWHDEWRIGPTRQAPATLHRRAEFSAWGADHVRTVIANEGEAGYARALLAQMRSVWPGAAEAKPMVIHDDEQHNKLSLDTSYTIGDGWRPSDRPGRIQWQFERSFGTELALAGRATREHDIFVGRPRRLSWRVHVEMPRAWPRTNTDESCELPGIKLTSRHGTADQHIDSFVELAVGAWIVPAAEAERYEQLVRRMQQDVLFIRADDGPTTIRPAGARKRLMILIGARLVIVAIWIALCVWMWR
ncbi:conserved hypothetical protein [Bradyrhizobium sp. ORS 375]|uniref:DUF3857 domain-containing transglutaminase family protein n=1 Tax=Bradyrhizobium sp. (strain ORS 375) TaxID=566679 RepID=UPI0002408569|nr:DUF3857 domain-containing transglutaminase family protein [Bradyrhizobium sp. ORS 375]CCD92059.1 conserved hypothetical protein [Bradyrhizobium sp. ORS 375]